MRRDGNSSLLLQHLLLLLKIPKYGLKGRMIISNYYRCIDNFVFYFCLSCSNNKTFISFSFEP